MGYANEVFKNVLSEQLNNLHTAMPCEVEKYDEEKELSDLQPLFQRKKLGVTMGYPLIEKVPKLKHVEPLEEGDIVLVVFAERALDFVGERRHDLRDAVIIGVMPCNDEASS